MSPVPAEMEIAELLGGLGFRSAAAQQAARAALEEAGLTNASKRRIATSKLDVVRCVLATRFVIACARAACRASVASRDARVVVAADRPTDCQLCRGQQNRAALDRAIAALVGAGLPRVVVVGGSPATHEELRTLSGERLDLRLISGTARRTARDAKADLEWADLVVVWGGTELDHTVSKLYTDTRDPRVVTCPRRGIAALAGTLIQAAERRR